MTGIVQDSGNTRYVGFSLPSDIVSSQDVRTGSDFWFYVVYVVSTIILYTTCVTTIFFLVNKTKKTKKKDTRSDDNSHTGTIEMRTSLSPKMNKKSVPGQDHSSPIKSFISKNPEILNSSMAVIIAFTFFEVFTEFVMAVLWSIFVEDILIAFVVFLAALVYYSPGIFSLCQICRECYLYYAKRPYTTSHAREDARVDTLFKCFIWTSSYFAYILLYSFFPAFVLAFAYPTRVITVFTFVATFTLLSIVYLTAYMQIGVTIKSCGTTNTGGNEEDRNCCKHPFIKFLAWCVLTITLIYYFLFIFSLLYALVIGRASVVSSAPLAILSLLPSILISIAAWIIKSTLLDDNSEDDGTESGGKNDITDGPGTSHCNNDHTNNENENTGEIGSNSSPGVETTTNI